MGGRFGMAKFNVSLDEDGRLVSMTIEHAKQQTDVGELSYQQVPE